MSGNEGNLQALSIEVGNAEAELTFAQAQVQSEIFKVLTAEQKQKIAERRKQMEARRGEMLKRQTGARAIGSGFQFQVPVPVQRSNRNWNWNGTETLHRRRITITCAGYPPQQSPVFSRRSRRMDETRSPHHHDRPLACTALTATLLSQSPTLRTPMPTETGDSRSRSSATCRMGRKAT